MTRTQRDVASFLVRFTQDLWQDDQGEPHVEWRGHVRHIQGDEQVRFTDFSEAVSFMQRNMKELTLGTLEALSVKEQTDRQNAVQESFGLWEKSAASYADMMFGAMEQARQQSETFQKQVGTAMQESLQAWTPSSPVESRQILEALQSLQTEVQSLAERVGGMEDALKE
jgi:hypothetical protein